MENFGFKPIKKAVAPLGLTAFLLFQQSPTQAGLST
jgi:hypothetical protein